MAIECACYRSYKKALKRLNPMRWKTWKGRKKISHKIRQIWFFLDDSEESFWREKFKVIAGINKTLFEQSHPLPQELLFLVCEYPWIKEEAEHITGIGRDMVYPCKSSVSRIPVLPTSLRPDQTKWWCGWEPNQFHLHKTLAVSLILT